MEVTRTLARDGFVQGATVVRQRFNFEQSLQYDNEYIPSVRVRIERLLTWPFKYTTLRLPHP